MRRVTVQKSPSRTSTRRVRRDESEELPRERPEIRKDVQRIWWPEG
jgi:hypothetical protein